MHPVPTFLFIHRFQLAVMLFFAFAAAVPREMLKREVTYDPAFHKNRTNLHASHWRPKALNTAMLSAYPLIV